MRRRGVHLGSAIHPQNEAIRIQYLKKIERDLSEQLNNAPCVIIANDPSGKVERLWVDISGFLCEIMVSNNTEEPAHFTMGIRDSGSLNGYRYIELNMASILEGKMEHDCEGIPVFIGLHKSHLAELMRKRALINEGKFDESILKQRVDEIDAKYKVQIKSLKEDNTRLLKEKEQIVKDKDRIIEQLTVQFSANVNKDIVFSIGNVKRP